MAQRKAGSYLTRRSQKTDPLNEALDFTLNGKPATEDMDEEEMEAMRKKVMEARKKKGKKKDSFTIE